MKYYTFTATFTLTTPSNRIYTYTFERSDLTITEVEDYMTYSEESLIDAFSRDLEGSFQIEENDIIRLKGRSKYANF